MDVPYFVVKLNVCAAGGRKAGILFDNGGKHGEKGKHHREEQNGVSNFHDLKLLKGLVGFKADVGQTQGVLFEKS